jgi:hypothetical protein
MDDPDPGATQLSKRTTNPWDAARRRKVVRGNHGMAPSPLEPGVKFFVLMLEQLGCMTQWSCEGHPKNFYISFTGPERIAREIAAVGLFAVEVSNPGYRLHLAYHELGYGARWTTRLHNRMLRHAAELWSARFGALGDRAHPPAAPGPGTMDHAMWKFIEASHKVTTALSYSYEALETAHNGLRAAIAGGEVALASRPTMEPTP